MATSDRRPRKIVELPGEELGALIGLMSGSDSVELKVTLPEEAQRSAVAALGLDPLEAQIRQVFFFDTPDLTLNQAGIAVRARRSQGRSGDTVVKLRPVVPQELPEDIRHSASLKVEVDAMPGGYVCSASMKGRATNEDVRDARRREGPHPQAVLEGAARVLHGPRPGGARARRPPRPRPDLRAEARHRPGRARPQAHRRDVAPSGRLEDPRALDEMPAERGVPGRGGDARPPGGGRPRSLRRDADEDEDGARAALRGARGEGRRG